MAKPASEEPPVQVCVGALQFGNRSAFLGRETSRAVATRRPRRIPLHREGLDRLPGCGTGLPVCIRTDESNDGLQGPVRRIGVPAMDAEHTTRGQADQHRTVGVELYVPHLREPEPAETGDEQRPVGLPASVFSLPRP